MMWWIVMHDSDSEDLQTLQFHEQVGGRRVARLAGKVVLVNHEEREKVSDGEWWLVRLEHKDNYAIAYLIEKRAPPTPPTSTAVSPPLAAPARARTTAVPVTTSSDTEDGSDSDYEVEDAIPVSADATRSEESRAPHEVRVLKAAADLGINISRGDRIALFIDGANMDFAGRKAGFFVDWARAKELFTGRGAFYAAYFYAATFADDDTNRVGWLDFLSHSGFVVRTKLAKRITDEETGEIHTKANLDVDMAVDVLATTAHWDVAFFFTGDGDFSRVVEHLRALGKRVYVVAGRGSLARELAYVADKPILLLEQLRELIEREDRHFEDSRLSV